MADTWRGKVVVITGASRGLGAGMAQAMAAHGVDLGLCARGAIDGPAAALTREADVRDPDAMASFAEAVVQRFGRIDLWINNAGVLEPITFVRHLSAAALADHLASHRGGVLIGSQLFARHVAGREGPGVLINISSGAALKGYAGWGAYGAGKAAVDRLSEALALEERAHGLRVHAVAPGVIDTGMQTLIRQQTAETFPAVEKFRALKRDDAFNTPAYVAEALLRVAFDRAARPETVVLRLAPEKAS